MTFEQRVSELGLRLPGPFGRVPSEVPLEAAQQSARMTALAMLGALRSALAVIMSAEVIVRP